MHVTPTPALVFEFCALVIEFFPSFDSQSLVESLAVEHVSWKQEKAESSFPVSQSVSFT